MKSVYHVTRILEYLATAQGNQISIRDMATALDINKSTLHRILMTLEETGFVMKPVGSQRYALGHKVLLLGRAHMKDFDLRKKTLPHLQQLRNTIEESVGLCVRMGKSRIFLDQLESPQTLKATVDITQLFPLHSGAAGKVLLAWLNRDHITEILTEVELVRYTGNTVISRERLMNELAAIRKQGYAIGIEETVKGVASIACPVWDFSGNVAAAVNIVGPSHRFDRGEMVRHLPLLKECTRTISVELGYVATA